MHVRLATVNSPDPYPVGGKGSDPLKEPYASPYCAMTDGGAEFEPSKFIQGYPVMLRFSEQI